MDQIENNVLEFSRVLGVEFDDLGLLKEALTHKSFVNENNVSWGHNERLEFLGDAVLELVVTDFLFNKFPEESEGRLTAYRAALVRTESIGQVALDMGVVNYMLLSRGERRDMMANPKLYLLANTYEAIVGAIYIDKGYDEAKRFIERTLFYKIDHVISDELWKDPKSKLQELVQERMSITPAYRLISEEGPDHDKKFVFGVYVDDQELGRGEGSSKQEAQQNAAKDALSGFEG